MASKGVHKMLEAGESAPAFRLRDLEGNTRTLEDIVAHGPALFTFFKVSCPVCQFTLPFLERLKGKGGLQMYTISQDDAEATQEFNQEFGVSLPALLDEEEKGYPASNAYGIASVPTFFQVEPDGRISYCWAGFSKADMEALGHHLGSAIFRPGEKVPDFKPG
jgi:peroxiredoxin